MKTWGAICVFLSATALAQGVQGNGRIVRHGQNISVPFCDAGYVVIGDGGSFTCTNSIGAGGLNTQMQYNSNGFLSGVTNLTSDGTNPGLVDVQSYPAASSSREVLASVSPAAAIPPTIYAISNQWGLAVPNGIMSANVYNGGADGVGNWMFSGARALGFNVAQNTNYSQGSATANEGSAGTIAWAATNYRTRNIFVNYGTALGSTNFSVGGIRENEFKCWLGNATGVGGCLYYTRIYINVVNNKQMFFFGLANVAGVLNPATILMSAQPNTFYVGCDTAGATLNVCSNGNGGSATCVDLGSNFPTQTTGAMYDIWLFVPPNPTLLWYDVERYDVRASASGALDGGNLPQNTVQLAWHDIVNLGDGGVNNIVASFGWQSSLLWTNY